jgi:hypothetical protein
VICKKIFPTFKTMSSFFVPRAPTIPASANFRDLMVDRLKAITGGGGGGDDNQPYKQQGQKLVGTGGTAYFPPPGLYYIQQGKSVSLSDDGSTLAIGGQGDDANIGATWIFTTSDGGTTWSQQGQKLVGMGSTSLFPNQGRSVALSANGSVLAVGASGDFETGETWVFVRDQNGAFIQQKRLVGMSSTGAAGQGISVALSADGLTLAVGGYGDDGGVGATWIFTGTDWSEQIKLVGTGASLPSNQEQGYSVALSADGLTLAVGGHYTDSKGATWIFTKDEELGTWSQQGGPLQSNNATANAEQGTSVALSDDGLVLAVGGPGNDDHTGATWVWTYSDDDEMWSENCFLVGTQADGKAQQGTSVSLSGDGSVLAVGGTNDNAYTGATWIFKRIVDLDPRVGSSWYQEGEKMVGTGYRKTAGSNTNSSQGWSVSLSGDGSVLAIGGPGDSANLGATWIFTAQ